MAAKVPSKTHGRSSKAKEDPSSDTYESVTDEEEDFVKGKARATSAKAAPKAAKPKAAAVKPPESTGAASSSTDGKKRAAMLAGLWEAQAAGLRQIFDM